MGWVYFIQHGTNGPVKIGTTTGNPHARLRALQTGAPEPLRLLCAIDGDAALERELHERFKALRLRADGEWFKADPELLWFVEGIFYAKRAEQPEDDGGGELSAADYALAAAALMFAETTIEDGNTWGWRPQDVAHLNRAIDEVRGLQADNAWEALDELVGRSADASADELLERLEWVMEQIKGRGAEEVH